MGVMEGQVNLYQCFRNYHNYSWEKILIYFFLTSLSRRWGIWEQKWFAQGHYALSWVLMVCPATKHPLGSWAPEPGITIKIFSRRAGEIEVKMDLANYKGRHESTTNVYSSKKDVSSLLQQTLYMSLLGLL